MTAATFEPGIDLTLTSPNSPGNGWWALLPVTSGRCWCSVPPRNVLRICVPLQIPRTGGRLP